MEDFVVARNPDGASSLPFLVRLPLRSGPVVLKVRETWPRMSKVYCHPSQDWPADPSIIERVPEPRLPQSCLKRVEHGGHRLRMGSEEVEIVGPAAHYASNDQRSTAGEGHSSALGQAGDNAAHAALQVGEH